MIVLGCTDDKQPSSSGQHTLTKGVAAYTVLWMQVMSLWQNWSRYHQQYIKPSNKQDQNLVHSTFFPFQGKIMSLKLRSTTIYRKNKMTICNDQHRYDNHSSDRCKFFYLLFLFVWLKCVCVWVKVVTYWTVCRNQGEQKRTRQPPTTNSNHDIHPYL